MKKQSGSNRLWMSIRSFHLMSLFFLLIALPRLATAQGYWEVRDTFTNQIVYPNGVISMFEDIAYPTIAQRVYRIANVSSFQLQLSPCTISGDPSFVIGANVTGSGPVYPGLATLVAIQHLPSAVGSQSATVTCSASGGVISFQVSGRVLDPQPYIVLDTLAGTNVPKSSTFDFGSTPAGTPVDKDFKITNLGNQTMTLGLSVSGPYSVVTPPPSTLAKGASATFRLRLLSSVTGTASGQLSIANNDPNDNPYYVFLTGSLTTPLASQIRITDNGNGGAVVTRGSTVNFGNIPTNTTVTRTFTLTNTGNTTLTISNPTTFVTNISGTSFGVGNSPANTLGTNSSTLFTITFQSAPPGSYSGTASLASNEPNSPFSFNLQANVTAPAPRIRIVDDTTGQTIVPGSTTINFGTVQPNVAATHSFSLHNDGTATLTLSNPAGFVSGNGFSLTSSPASSILAGQLTHFSIRFLNAASGSYSGSASLLHNDPAVRSPLAFNLQASVPVASAPVVTLTASDPEASETSPNSGQFTLTRTGSTATALTVNLNISGTATNGTDYSPAIGTSWTFQAGQSTLTIPVTPVDDSAIEDVETVTLSLASSAAYSIGSSGTGTVSITNNDYTPCTPSATVLCLQGGRFEATLTAVANGASYVGQTLSLGDASGGFWLFSRDNIEVGVKVLDGAAVNGKFWIYHGAATDVAYTLIVRDRANASRSRTFTKAAGGFCGGSDLDLFTKSLPRARSPRPGQSEQLTAFTCAPNSTTVCLLNGRFQVRVKRGTVYQQVIPATSQTAFFSFFSPDNLEIFVKVLDGTALNSRYWVFYGSMTDQTYTVEVTDSVTGLVKNYPNGTALCGNADTSAF